MRAADSLAQALVDNGTKVVFALSGNQIMPIFDALLDTPIRLIHTRHEAAAGFMAEGYAQISGSTGVALVTAGAGLGNAISPLLTARASQTPMLLLSGDSPAGQDGRGTFQEMDQVALTQSATKLSRRIVDGARLGAWVDDAFAVAAEGQPGPVHLSLPVDALTADVSPVVSSRLAVEEASPPVAGILDALSAAERPLVLLGPAFNGIRSRNDFTTLGLPAVAMESPRGANDPSLGRFALAWQKADLVLVLGKPVDFSTKFGGDEAWPNARWITVHGDVEEVARAESNLGDRLIEAYHGAPQHVAEALFDQRDALPDCSDWHREVLGLIAERPEFEPTLNGIGSPELCLAVQSLVRSSSDPIFVSDGGEIGQWAQALVSAPRRIVNGVSGAIGGGIGYAIGAKAAAPESDVILLMGDGTAGFHIAEFETAVRADLPFVAVIGNDRRWNAEHEIQRRSFGAERMHNCELSGARYDQMVEAMGGFGAYVTAADQLDDALKRALASGRPACVNVEIEGRPAPSF